MQDLLRARYRSNVTVKGVAFPGMTAQMREACADTLLPPGGGGDMYIIEASSGLGQRREEVAGEIGSLRRLVTDLQVCSGEVEPFDLPSHWPSWDRHALQSMRTDSVCPARPLGSLPRSTNLACARPDLVSHCPIYTPGERCGSGIGSAHQANVAVQARPGKGGQHEHGGGRGRGVGVGAQRELKKTASRRKN